MSKHNFIKAFVAFIICLVLFYVYMWDLISNYVNTVISTYVLLFLIGVYFIYILITLVVDRKIEKNEKSGFILFYIILLVILFYTKTVTIDSSTNILNLDVRNFKYSLTTDIGFIVVMMNVLLLVPLGYLFREFNIVFKLIFPVFLSLLVEYTQYNFNVGIFDINDIILNSLGFYIGTFMLPKLTKK